MDYAGWLLVVDMLEQEQIDPSRALRKHAEVDAVGSD